MNKFLRWELPDPTTVAPLFDPGKRRGIYVLEFRNGERYVGQTTDVVSRYSAHRHGSAHHAPWDDVAAIEFCWIPCGDLDGPERHEIEVRRGLGTLRNRTRNLGHWEPSTLDDYVKPTLQRHWATGQPQYSSEHFAAAAQKLSPRIPRLLMSKRGAEILPTGRVVWEAVVDELAQIVALAIPNAIETEGRFWAISDNPETAGGRFATLNVGSMELAYFSRLRFEPEEGTLDSSDGLVTVLNAELGTFLPEHEIPKEFNKSDSLVAVGSIDNHAIEYHRIPSNYAVPVDSIQMPLGVFGASSLDDGELAGVRALALHLMRRGSARINARSRSESLTRLVYKRIASKPDWPSELPSL